MAILGVYMLATAQTPASLKTNYFKVLLLRPWQLNVLIAIVLTIGFNQKFFSSLLTIGDSHISLSLTMLLLLLNLLLCQLGGSGKWQKPWLLLLLSISACSQYFMLNYGVVIDKNMLKNALETDSAEIFGLLSFTMVPYFLFNLLLPATLLFIIPVSNKVSAPTGRKIGSVLRYFAVLLGCFSVIMVLVASQYKTYSSVFREHRYLKHQTLPLSALTASVGLFGATPAMAHSHQSYATDALQQLSAGSKPRLILFVLGETVRADHFGINGYARDTTPKLAKRKLINFGAISSCGTATAISVPCMFSYLTKDTYDEATAKGSDNLLDVLQRAGVKVLWRNNNSGCKTMCDRVEQDNQFAINSQYKCNDGDCPDLALLERLKQRILQQDSAQSQFIVLHQQGNHGPEYYKRSLEQHKVFMPECRTNLLSDCQQQHIINAYDNAIVSTDLLLDNSITLLESLADKYDTALIYASDHGESLGENGVYLHGLPYWMAPDAQTKVPMLFWLSDDFSKHTKLHGNCLLQNTNLSHDNIFDTVLSLFAVKTTQLRVELDVTSGCTNR
ncbi:MAG: phosphoethanolamine transferase [Rheinheimera sp.]|jgi:lipid A ethanolaminephosphotransferase|uniref:phosphoethanolamine transferase n=1 Tax=Rheinheimera sp. TaxID=1869214 RepID=UPI000C60C90A|nr:phosphoethanolamine transferase [Rheinheimera sp.]|tara:strand:- start:91696 stop:93372 length:1677 start_codon:yes stop_codon:yes gene_type:complete